MTLTLSNRLAALAFAATVMLTAWLPTVTVPVAPILAAAAPVAVELA